MRIMRITYDEEADAAYIYLVATIGRGEVAGGTACKTDLEHASVVLDFDTEGKLLGIELLGVSHALRPEGVGLLTEAAD